MDINETFHRLRGYTYDEVSYKLSVSPWATREEKDAIIRRCGWDPTAFTFEYIERSVNKYLNGN